MAYKLEEHQHNFSFTSLAVLGPEVGGGKVPLKAQVVRCEARIVEVSSKETRRFFTILYCTVLYCTVLYCTVLYCTTQKGRR